MADDGITRWALAERLLLFGAPVHAVAASLTPGWLRHGRRPPRADVATVLTRGRSSRRWSAACGLALASLLGAHALRAQAAYAHPCAEHTQTALNECAWQKYRAAEAELTKAYTATLARDTARAPLLARAQRAWLTFRDVQCAYVAREYQGGSMQPMQEGACLEALTRARIRQLRDIAAW